ncbi:E3 ubiquitin-protein ligase ari-1.1-like [Paramacrobiotus metropolitanus]|uniref:E3 ubiquitin-protein ligase ari-1.1-like n=1 Tax=Paramacrobiotus metropolitanus TaxID=2943436 RepID=UPI0024459514|nr:E3 ubiquitin-protein ligase ari-1.1-like [Paramacrobiotus metropolitanus]
MARHVKVPRSSAPGTASGVDDYDWEMEYTLTKPLKTTEAEYTVQPYKHLAEDMRIKIRETADVLQISPTCARLLLAQKKWNVDDCAAMCYERSDKYLANLINIPVSSLRLHEWTLCEKKASRQHGLIMSACPICLEEVYANQLQSLSCLHIYCIGCWRNYIDSQIDGEMDKRIVIRCMFPKCEMLLGDECIEQLADTRQATVYWKQIEKLYVDSFPRLRSCRGLDCTYAMDISADDQERNAVDLKCICGYVQCSMCTNEGHEGLPCWLIEKWIKKLGSDTDQPTLQWLMSNTKECPKCKYNIEKTGGCNHMTCRNCRNEFCWMCGEQWRGHSNCTQYCGDAQGENFTAKAWEQMERLIFYASRYTNQMDNILKEKPLKELPTKVSTLLLEPAHASTPANYTEFVGHAVSVLETCRRHLWQCFGFSFFVKPSRHRELFDHNIENLERDVDELSGFLEQTLSPNLELFSKYRGKTLTLSGKCQMRLKHLMGHIAEGFSKNWWAFDDVA